MKIINIKPTNVLIVETGLEHTITNEFNKLKYYFENKSSKKIVTTLYNGHYVALDGNKLCTVHRILKKQVEVILLENENDFIEFYKFYCSNLYNSKLLKYGNWLKVQEELDFFIKQFGNFIKKDFFDNISKCEMLHAESIKFGYSFNLYDLKYNKIDE